MWLLTVEERLKVGIAPEHIAQAQLQKVTKEIIHQWQIAGPSWCSLGEWLESPMGQSLRKEAGC